MGIAGRSDRDGDSGRKKLGLPALSPQQRPLFFLPGMGSLGPGSSLWDMEGQSFLSRADGVGIGGVCPWASPRATGMRGCRGGGVPGLVARVSLAGGGEPADARYLRAAAAAGAPNAPLSPSPRLGALSPPIIQLGGLFLSSKFQMLPPPPPASALSRGGAEGRRSPVLRPPLGKRGPVAGTPGSSSPAPAAPPPPAPARAPFTTEIAQGAGPGSVVPRRARREAVRESA
jgi:hypothetical protein